MRWVGLLSCLGLVLTTFAIGLAAPTAPAVPPSADAARIGQLIAQLGNDDYFVRERAQEQLAAIGIEAFDALSEAENHPDVEVAQRVRYLLRLVRVQWARGSDPPEIKRLLDEYGAGNDEEREKKIVLLASQPLPHSVSVLCRIVRFEKSNLLSRLAALAIIEQKPADAAEQRQRLELIDQSLGASPRPTAQWLRAYVSVERDPAGSVAAWSKLLDDEERTLQQFPSHTRSDIVVRLIKQHAMLLGQLGRRDESLAVMRRMLTLEPENNDELANTLQWLVEQKAWPLIDEAAKRFEERFAQDPMLLYVLAEACEAQGNKQLADANVQRARQLNEDNQVQHLFVGFKLQKRGRIAWSAEEYRLSIKVGQPGQAITMEALSRLSEMLHDQGEELPAAKVLEEGVAAAEAAINAGKQVDDIALLLKQDRARMHYFFACDAANKNEQAAQFDHLQKALANDPLDADVLIGLHRHPKLNDAQRADVVQKIAAAARQFRSQIQESPDDPTPYNQLAWLIANTEGDFQEALRCSQKSLELRPGTSSYLDTLGRCYFAVGDIDNALKSQTQAVALEPHSGLLQRQLEQFKKAKAEKKPE